MYNIVNKISKKLFQLPWDKSKNNIIKINTEKFEKYVKITSIRYKYNEFTFKRKRVEYVKKIENIQDVEVYKKQIFDDNKLDILQPYSDSITLKPRLKKIKTLDNKRNKFDNRMDEIKTGVKRKRNDTVIKRKLKRPNVEKRGNSYRIRFKIKGIPFQYVCNTQQDCIDWYNEKMNAFVGKTLEEFEKMNN